MSIDVSKRTCFLVRLSEGGSIVLEGESFQPYEPSAYVHNEYWECIAYSPFEPDRTFAVYPSDGAVAEVDEDGDETEIGYVPRLRLAARQQSELEEIDEKLELAYEAWGEGSMPDDLYNLRSQQSTEAKTILVKKHLRQMALLNKKESRRTPYPGFCIHPEHCLGLSCCRRERTCVD